MKPITQDQLEGNNTIPKEGHLQGTAISQISFIGRRHTALMSSDDNGYLVCHEGGRSIMGYWVKSKILFGKRDKIPSIDHNSIISFSPLPIGSSPQLTDNIGVLAVITPHALIVISTQPSLQTHYKVGKPKILNETFGLTAMVRWFPALRNKTEGTTNLPLLAYCWSNVLTVFEVGSDTITDSNDYCGDDEVS
ncbi:unnamed protein product [Ambrosiozyma monospora]|uniref:Unnamed protein product n=1 Tax=Ambrosiozyma monospora TaxID=43982 RepID=A0ACB5TNH8_AMBMO|nr:unnamed protein product [Ambrosiozyma monospora]